MLISTGVQHGTIFAPQPFGLPLGETTTPQYLKSLGYTARGVGKVCSSALFTSLNFTRPLLLHISERDPFQLRSVPTTHSSLVSVTSFPRVFYAMWKTTFVVHSIFFVGSIEIDFFSCFSGTWASLKRSIPQHSEDLTRSTDTGQERLIIGPIDHLKTIGDWILGITWRYIAVRLSSKALERNKGNDR